MDIIVVYDYLGPNGYIPFNYEKDIISTILHNEQYRTKPREDISPNVTKILSKNILVNDLTVRNNLYLVLIDKKLENTELSNILSDTLLLLLNNYPNNIKTIYVNFNKDTMSTFL